MIIGSFKSWSKPTNPSVIYNNVMNGYELGSRLVALNIAYQRKNIDMCLINQILLERYLDNLVELQRDNVKKYKVERLSSVKDFINIGLDKKSPRKQSVLNKKGRC